TTRRTGTPRRARARRGVASLPLSEGDDLPGAVRGFLELRSPARLECEVPAAPAVGELVPARVRRHRIVALAQDVDVGDLHPQVGSELEVGGELLAVGVAEPGLYGSHLVDAARRERRAVAVEERPDGRLVAIALFCPGDRLPGQPGRARAGRGDVGSLTGGPGWRGRGRRRGRPAGVGGPRPRRLP